MYVSLAARLTDCRIVDWGFVELVPIVRAAGLPRFLWPDSPGYLQSTVMQKVRESYIMSFASQCSQGALYMQLADFHHGYSMAWSMDVVLQLLYIS
jgi:hypothetical protein